jgi:hypothetical protein
MLPLEPLYVSEPTTGKSLDDSGELIEDDWFDMIIISPTSLSGASVARICRGRKYYNRRGCVSKKTDAIAEPGPLPKCQTDSDGG